MIDGKNTCVCLGTGYDGPFCEQDIDECLEEILQCKNSGTCQNNNGSFSCQCRAGFNGTRCEINIDDCRPDSCKNHGTCEDLVNNFRCECQKGYDGDFCENNVDECENHECKNGNCVDGIDKYTCDCNGTDFKVKNCTSTK